MAASQPNGTAPAPSTCFSWSGGPGVKRVNLALQGGGAHGAYTWGVLDALLGDERIEIEAISGTSAGAMNAAVLAAGLMHGGRQGARAALKQFWLQISRDAAFSPIRRTPVDVVAGDWSLDRNPMLTALDVWSRVVSPYEFNPMNWNPLRELIGGMVDFEAVHACKCVQLFISATNVRSGTVRIFTGEELDADVIMASACLPFLFQAVQIDGEPYWDGGYMGNPVLSPFFKSCATPDIVIVQVNPILRDNTPKSAREIQDRINEISFNAPLLRELRHVTFINDALQRGELKDQGYREVYLHRIGGHELQDFGASTKLNAEWAFLRHLRDIGRKSARDWLGSNFDCLGSASTITLHGRGEKLRIDENADQAKAAE